MSTKAQLDKIVRALRLEWTEQDGSLAIIRGLKGNELFRICCGCDSNPFIVAENCRVWQGSDQVYKGALTGLALFHALQTGAACTAEITTVSRIRRGKKGISMCCGKSCRKTCMECKLRC